jgi:LacI family transcriptional regulator, gluconate utilization system Gnt-I transcriptional repressor
VRERDTVLTSHNGATLADVAREAGVGESTASRVLRRQGSVSERTRAKVERAAERLAYVPNRLAGTLASTGSNLVGIIIPSLTNIVFPDFLRGVNHVLETHGHQSVIAVSEYDAAREEKLIASLLSWRPAGLVLVGLDHTEGAIALLRASGTRLVEVYDTDGAGLDRLVGFSNRQAGAVAARHLIGRGYRRIGYVGHKIHLDIRAVKRFEGFCAALKEAGLEVVAREIGSGTSSVEAGREGLARLLDQGSELDACYFSNDDMALGGYFHCLAQGIRVPAQLALFGHNGLDMARFAPQPLSSIRTPRAAMGEVAARMVLGQEEARLIDLGFELLEGGTT